MILLNYIYFLEYIQNASMLSRPFSYHIPYQPYVLISGSRDDEGTDMKRAVLLYFDQIFSTRKHLQLANCNVIPIKESPKNGCDIFRNRVMYFLYQPAGICQMYFIRF